MIILFYFFFILQVASLYLFQTSSLIDPIIYGYILLDAIILIIILGKKLKQKIFILISLSLITRLCFLVYMKTFKIYLSADWVRFVGQAQRYMNGWSDSVGTYPIILSFFFTSTGFNCDYTVLPIILNIFCSIINIYTVYLILNYLKVSRKLQTVLIGILCFMPIQCGYAMEIIRETLPTLLVTVSLLFFIKWFYSNKITFIMLAFICSFAAAAFHAGCIAVSIAYAYTFAFYDFKRVVLQISLQKILFYFPVVFLFAIYIFLNSDVFLGKFSGLTDLNSLESELGSWANVNAGSAYLTWLDGASLPVQIITLPLKAFYFLFSPIIFDIRDLQDLFVLFFDASVFIISVVYYLKIKNEIQDKRIRFLVTILFFTLCTVACVFGLGVSNTGTAMRHRNKFIALPLVIFAIAYTYNKTALKRNTP